MTSSEEVLQYAYNNPYRRHSSIGLPVKHQFPETEYEDKFVELETSSKIRGRPSDNLEDLRGLDRRRERSDWNTENKENFKKNSVTKIVRARAYSNIGLFDDKLSDTSETRDAYKARYGRRAVTTGQVSLSSESSSPSVDQLLSARPGRSGGMFSMTSETSARYGRRQGLTDKPSKYTMRDNLKTPGPDAKMETYSAHREQFRPPAVSRTVKYTQKANIKTFDDNYLLNLEKDIMKNKEKKRSISLHSLQDVDVVGEDEILYKANNYTNT